MTNSTWQQSAMNGNYLDTNNWTQANIPDANSIAFFGTSVQTTISNITGSVGSWIFNIGASNYDFTIGIVWSFFGDGIIVNGGAVTIHVSDQVQFLNNSSAGKATIFISGGNLDFHDGSTAGTADIENVDGTLLFSDNSTGGTATIDTSGSATVDFSESSGPAGDHRLTVGSIAGVGSYDLGRNQLTVGGNGQSTTVGGAISDGGTGGGSGGSLVKVGYGTLTLTGANNTYSGGTTLRAGALDLGAIGAAGTGPIIFTPGKQTLKIEDTALSDRRFGNAIDDFGKKDILDLTGLHFHAGATAKYHHATHLLAVHSGSVTDTLTLNAPASTHFSVEHDGHGGSEVFLVFA
jgi:autotransporter-associated beta strand protein